MDVSLGQNRAFSALGTADSDVCLQVRDLVSVYVRSTADGTMEVLRIGFDGSLNSIAAPVAVSATVEKRITLDFPFERAIVRFTDTSGGAGTVSFDAVWVVR